MKLVIIAAFLCLLVVPVYAEMASIKGEGVHLRNGPGKNYGSEWKYGDGFPVKVIERQKDWVKVSDFEGESGWIFHTLLAKKRTVIINTGNDPQIVAAVRVQRDRNAAAVAEAHHGVIFTLMQQKGEWLEVESGTGITGWIERRFVWGY